MENLEEIKEDLENTSSLYGETIPVKWVYDYIDKAFSVGRLQALSEAEGVVPEEIDTSEGSSQDPAVAYDIGKNDCRKQTLDNLAKLKGKE